MFLCLCSDECFSVRLLKTTVVAFLAFCLSGSITTVQEICVHGHFQTRRSGRTNGLPCHQVFCPSNLFVFLVALQEFFGVCSFTDEKKRKSKWDALPPGLPSQPQRGSGGTAPNLTTSATGTRATIISAVGTLTKKNTFNIINTTGPTKWCWCVCGDARGRMTQWVCAEVCWNLQQEETQHRHMRLDHQSDADACVCEQVCRDVCVCNWVFVEVGQKSHQEDFFQRYQYDQAIKVIDINAWVWLSVRMWVRNCQQGNHFQQCQYKAIKAMHVWECVRAYVCENESVVMWIIVPPSFLFSPKRTPSISSVYQAIKMKLMPVTVPSELSKRKHLQLHPFNHQSDAGACMWLSWCVMLIIVLASFWISELSLRPPPTSSILWEWDDDTCVWVGGRCG